MQTIGSLRFSVKQGLSVCISQGVIDELPKGKVKTAQIYFYYVQLSPKALRDLFFAPDIDVDCMIGQLTSKTEDCRELFDQLSESMNEYELTQ